MDKLVIYMVNKLVVLQRMLVFACFTSRNIMCITTDNKIKNICNMTLYDIVVYESESLSNKR
jgi:hypothetical protein